MALLLAAAACTAGPSGDPGGTSDAGLRAEARGAKAGGAAGANIVRLLPEASDVRPWTLTGRRLSYDAATLSDYIDGAAETYLDYGFIRVVGQEYSSGSESLMCSVYEMRDAEAAFGIFSSLRSPLKRRLEVGDDGFRADAQVAFRQARYYVTVESYSPRGAGDRALETFARAVSGRIGVRSAPPPVLSRLPRRDLQPLTERLLKGRSAANELAALGGAPGAPLMDAGTIVLAGDYETAGDRWRLLVVLGAGAETVEHLRGLPGRLFTPSAGYVPVTAHAVTDTGVWMRQGRAFASQPIDGGVRLVVDATRLEAARAALVNAADSR